MISIKEESEEDVCCYIIMVVLCYVRRVEAAPEGQKR